jgi:hypothetical protein
MSDDFDIDIRLCDDDGRVSDEPIEGEHTLDESYIARHLRLQRMTERGREFLKLHPNVEEGGWGCTGHAHLAGIHILCTSPAHLRTGTAAPVMVST